MRIIITSDSHGRLDVLQRIAALEKADLYLDAGDSEREERELFPFLTVKGNRDYLVPNRFRIVDAGEERIFLFHGDRSPLSAVYLAGLARNNNCRIIIHGHTHVPYYTVHDGIHILCPGSVAYPRSLKGTTYAVLNIGSEIEAEIKKVK
ncbi:MAG TPA: YfcE family phosphodiesterase [Bacilli bacterium]